MNQKRNELLRVVRQRQLEQRRHALEVQTQAIEGLRTELEVLQRTHDAMAALFVAKDLVETCRDAED